MILSDKERRPLRNLRISVTDRCNLRCLYCMPEKDYVWLPRTDLLAFEEIRRLAQVFAGMGVEAVRLTGGEPLLRSDLDVLVRLLAEEPGIRDLSMTTNGVLLAENAARLQAAGLHRVTVSLDTLRPDRFGAIARRLDHDRVLQGIEAAGRAGLRSVKINTVVVRGVNDDELVDLIEFGRSVGAEVRFIEYMDVGGATQWSREQVVTREEILGELRKQYGAVEPACADRSAPAARYRLPDGTLFGIIASTTEPFCGSCDRSRVTADGMWYLCLYARSGIDLREPLRQGVSDAEIAARIHAAWSGRADRGAEERMKLIARRVLHGAPALRDDPHLEMHTRGG